MHTWPVQDTETTVLASIDEWHWLQTVARPSLKRLLLADVARTDMLVPKHNKTRHRQSTTLR